MLIIVDTFQIIRTASNDPSYGGDYEDVKRLKYMAERLMNLQFPREKYVWEVVSDSREEIEVRLPTELRAPIKYM